MVVLTSPQGAKSDKGDTSYRGVTPVNYLQIPILFLKVTPRAMRETGTVKDRGAQASPRAFSAFGAL